MEKNIDCRECKNQNCFLKAAQEEAGDLIRANKGMYSLVKGSKVIQKGDIVAGIYFIYEGPVKVFYEEKDGKGVIFRFASDGNILGHRGYGGQMVYPISAQTLGQSRICFLRNEIFLEILKKSATFALKMMFLFAEELHEMENRFRKMTKMTRKQKIADALLMVHKTFGFREDGKTLNIILSRKDLADTIGAAPEVASRLVKDLQNEGLLELEGKKIILPDLEALRDLVGIV